MQINVWALCTVSLGLAGRDFIVSRLRICSVFVKTLVSSHLHFYLMVINAPKLMDTTESERLVRSRTAVLDQFVDDSLRY